MDIRLLVIGFVAFGCAARPPLNVQTLVAGDVVITEVMMNPEAVADHVGEWIEVFVPGERDVNLDDVVVRNNAGAGGRINGDGDVIVAAGSYAVIARRDEDVFASPEYAPTGYWGQDPGFEDDEDKVQLEATAGIIDETYLFGPVEATLGVAWQLDPAKIDATSNDSPTSWCSAVSELDNGDFGTPGELNDPCE